MQSNYRIFVGTFPDGVLGADKHRRFTPHLTLAMRLKDAPAPAILDDLHRNEWGEQRFSTSITRLNFMQRSPEDPCWRPIAILNMNQNP
jgi:2'-5' RNA ligase